jgi:hypothetical protein
MTWNPVACTLGPLVRLFILFYFFLSFLSIFLTKFISFTQLFYSV